MFIMFDFNDAYLLRKENLAIKSKEPKEYEDDYEYEDEDYEDYDDYDDEGDEDDEDDEDYK